MQSNLVDEKTRQCRLSCPGTGEAKVPGEGGRLMLGGQNQSSRANGDNSDNSEFFYVVLPTSL
jgi:hypothetical protein